MIIPVEFISPIYLTCKLNSAKRSIFIVTVTQLHQIDANYGLYVKMLP